MLWTASFVDGPLHGERRSFSFEEAAPRELVFSRHPGGWSLAAWRVPVGAVSGECSCRYVLRDFVRANGRGSARYGLAISEAKGGS